tara:strand:+ start:94 stop:1422 length:1329 start_codon:yes stop_codon:yes gene_type:complete
MKVKQFEYKPLSHYSYAVISNGEMAIIDPERNPMQYYAIARANNAKIIAVIETHPHADFVSSHLQIHNETGAIIYNSEKLGAEYPYTPFDEGHNIKIGNATLSAINTPGHSPDSITIVATQGDETVLFTGDTVFIGDVGRPDLREKAGNIKAKRQKLAEAMYDTIQHKFTELPDNAVVYPAHGAGSLCGKSLSEANSSTLGNERMGNWAFKKQTQDQFVEKLLDSQPFIPSYFGFNVDVNKSGAANLRTAIAAVPFMMNTSVDGLIIDVRNEIEFKKGSLKGSINIPATSEDSRFETWLGAIVEPNEKFSLVIDNPEDLDHILNRVAKIGYENHLQAVVTLPEGNLIKLPQIDINDFRNNPKKYTILDVRNESEVEEEKFFENALSHPLNELRKTANEIPTDKPIVVHCAGGYRSAVGSSILAKELKATQVFDLGEQINEFK